MKARKVGVNLIEGGVEEERARSPRRDREASVNGGVVSGMVNVRKRGIRNRSRRMGYYWFVITFQPTEMKDFR